MKILNSLKKNNNAIAIDPSFALIKSINRDGTITYSFSYTIDQVALIKSKIVNVRLSIRIEQTNKQKSIFSLSEAKQNITPIDIVKNIVFAPAVNKQQAFNNNVNVIKAVNVTPKLAITPAVIKTIKAANVVDAPKLLPILKTVTTKKVSAVKASVTSLPVFKMAIKVNPVPQVQAPQIVAKVDNVQSLQAASLALISKKITPLNIIGKDLNVAPTQDVLGGLTIKKIAVPPIQVVQPKFSIPFESLTKASLILNSDADLLIDVDMPIVEYGTQQHVTITRDIVLPPEINDNDGFFVDFKLMGKNNESLATIQRKVNHGALLRKFNTPRLSPKATISSKQVFGRNVIELFQYDDRASMIKMYRRTINRLTNINDTLEAAYTFAGDIALTKNDGHLKLVDYVNNSSTIIYRFIAVGPDGQLGSTFTDVVAGGQKFGSRRLRRENIFVAFNVTAAHDNTAIIQVTNIRKGPVAIGILRRNCTLHEPKFSLIGSTPIHLLDNDEDITFADTNVKTDHVYEYRAMLYFDHGSSIEASGYAIYEHTRSGEDTGVTINVSSPEIVHSTNGGPGSTHDVTFNIASLIDDSDMDMIKTLLEQQGLTELYAAELKQGKSGLKQLVAHAVSRINTSSGVTEDFGIITDNKFSDIAQGARNACRPVQSGVTYRYVITTLLRAADTLFNDHQQTKTSTKTIATSKTQLKGLANNQYVFSPAKYLHPITLKKGTLTTPITRATNHASAEFSYGKLGNVKMIDVTIPSIVPRLQNITVQRVSNFKNVITWDVIGDIDMIDYFLCTFNSLGTEQVIGAVHAMNNSATFEFTHDLTSTDVGTATYAVTVMYSNFEKGSKLTSAIIKI